MILGGKQYDKRGYFINWRYNSINIATIVFFNVYDLSLTAGEVAGTYPDNILLITMYGHITCSKYGIVYDSFDCRDRFVEYCWIVK